ncbi:MAG: glycosyltransferase family 39 protein [Terracidiphilus sp.]|jgi:4-amino-4-deoxy-L-arabinose transferase-like glycosyltransferase
MPISTSPHAQPRQSSRWLIPGIVLAAFVIRLVVVCFNYRDLPDADKLYEQFGWEMGWIARAMASGHGYSSPYWPWTGPTAMQPPLYPSLLSLVFRLFGIYSLTSGFVILSINSLLSALTCIGVYFSAKYSLGARGAKIAACVWALYPFGIYFSAGRVWEYSLTGLLFTTCFCIAQRIHRAATPLAWLGWGALFGVTALSNPSVLSTLPFLLALALYKVRRAGGRWILFGSLTTLAAIAVLAPWTVRNYRTLGILCPVRDNFWLEVYDDNSGDASLDPSSAHPSSNPVEMRKFLTMGEPAFLAEKHTLAVVYLHDHPEFFVHKTLRRMLYYWTGYWSFSAEELREQPYEPANVFYVCSITFLMLLGIRRLWRLNRATLLPYLVLIAIFPVTYYVTHPLMDYRQPIEPAIIVLAVSGVLSWRRIPNPVSDVQLKSKWGSWIEPEVTVGPLLPSSDLSE